MAENNEMKPEVVHGGQLLHTLRPRHPMIVPRHSIQSIPIIKCSHDRSHLAALPWSNRQSPSDGSVHISLGRILVSTTTKSYNTKFYVHPGHCGHHKSPMIPTTSTNIPCIYNLVKISLATLTIFRFSAARSTVDWPGLRAKGIFSAPSRVDLASATSSADSGVLNCLAA